MPLLTPPEYVVRFLHTYAEQHALLPPGRIPGYSRSDIQLLPSSVSKRKVWRVYHAAAEAISTVHAVAYTTFCLLWRTLVPSIIVMKPRSDLCWKCQENSTAIMHSSNGSEAEKTSTISEALEHLRIVKMERTYYKSICDECKASIEGHFITDGKCDRIRENPPYGIRARFAQCTFLVAQVEICRSPDFVIYMSNNPSSLTVAIFYGG